MGLFGNKKSPREKQREREIDELLSKLDGKLLSNSPRFDYVAYNYVEISGLGTVIFSIRNLKAILKKEMVNEKLSEEHLEERIIELLQLDWEKLFSNSHKLDDTSIFHTQEDVINYFGEKYNSKKFFKKQEKIKNTHRKYNEKQQELKKENIAKNDFNNEIKRIIGNGYYKCKFGYYEIDANEIKKIIESEIEKNILYVENIEDRVNELIDNNDKPSTITQKVIDNPTETKIKYCGNCGARVLEGAKFCANCGNKLTPPLKEKIVTNQTKSENKLKTFGLTPKEREKILNVKVTDATPFASEIREIQDIARRNNPNEMNELKTKQSELIIKIKNEKEKIKKGNNKTILDKIKENEAIANELRLGTEDQKTEAIRIYEENISYGVCCDSYSNLIKLYSWRNEYDKAIDATEKAIEVFSKNGEPTQYFERELEILADRQTLHLIVQNQQIATQLEERGEIDKAIEILDLNIKLDATHTYTFPFLARLYHYKKDFEKERDMYVYAIASIKQGNVPRDTLNFEESLDNVQTFLDTGKWKYDCLPNDPKAIYYKIKEAKTLINSEDKEKGIALLEEIMENGTYNNTVYNTLYQTYNKDKKFDDSIRVCENAIEVLGFFSNDRKYRWQINLNKAIKRKEKTKK